MQAQGAAPEHNKHTGIDTMPVVFAEVNRTASTQSALQITRQDVCIYLTNSQEAHLAAELIAYLRRSC